jgi:hypothetical protein
MTGPMVLPVQGVAVMALVPMVRDLVHLANADRGRMARRRDDRVDRMKMGNDQTVRESDHLVNADRGQMARRQDGRGVRMKMGNDRIVRDSQGLANLDHDRMVRHRNDRVRMENDQMARREKVQIDVPMYPALRSGTTRILALRR